MELKKLVLMELPEFRNYLLLHSKKERKKLIILKKYILRCYKTKHS